MRKDIKGQISVEMLAVVGVVIVGSLIFATYYLSSVNRNIDQATDIDVNFGDFLPTGDGVGGIEGVDPGTNGGGNGGANGGGDECQVPPDVCAPGNTIDCADLGSYESQILNCQDYPVCNYDTSPCVPLPGFLDLTVIFTENNDFQIDAAKDEVKDIKATLENVTDSADLTVSSSVYDESISDYIPTNKCSYDGTLIASGASHHIGNYNFDQDVSGNVSCSDLGTYKFEFKLNDGSFQAVSVLELTVIEAEPPSPTVFSLCGKDPGTEVTFCINHLNNDHNPVNGVTFYVNFPDYAEHKEESPACDGNNCFYLGISS